MGKTIPTLEEVIEYYKNVKTIKGIYSGKEKTIDTEKLGIYFDGFNFRQNEDDEYAELLLWDGELSEYAKILSYKKPKEETFFITREQILELHKNSCANLKYDIEQLFPSAFKEEKKELAVEKWYKDKYGRLFCPTEIINSKKCKGYGFGCVKKQFLSIDSKFDWEINGSEVEATPKEVEGALIKEAVKIGYHTDKPIHINYKNGSGFMKNPSKNDFWFRDGILYLWDIKIFEEGVWSEIIPTITKQEAEEKLNCKII